MKIQKQRTLFEIINLLLSFLLVIPTAVVIEQLCGYPIFRCCMIPCMSLLAYVAGRWSMPRSFQAAVAACIISVLAAVLLSLVLAPAGILIRILLPLYTLFFSVFYFFTARKAGYTVFSPMAVSGIVLHIISLIFCVGFEISDEAITVASAAAIIFFLLSLYAFSAKGLRKSLHKNNAEKHVTYPAGMQMGNFLLVTGFILIAAFISNIHPIFKVFSGLFVYVLRAIGAFFGFFTGLFTRRSVGTDVDEGVSESAAEDSILNAEPKGEASWVTLSVEIFAFILVVLLFAYLAYKVIQRLRKAGMKMPAFLKNLRDRFNPVTEEDFTDETEDLFDAKKVLSNTGTRLREALAKMRERPQKISDFEDNRMKIRFTYQQLLKRVSTRDPHAAAKTPNEIYAQEYPGEDDFREFMDAYNLARYSTDEINDEAVDCAQDILSQKM